MQAGNDIMVRASVPQVITKELAVADVGGRRRVRLSTNFLPLMGFSAGTRHSVDLAPAGCGLRLAYATNGPQKVYERRYRRRSNNPFETVIEIANQSILDQALPNWTERVHIQMRSGEILIRPLQNRTFTIRKRLKESTTLAAMVAMTAGVDVHCLEACGFHVDSVLEYRPQEARDHQDLTETGALNTIANCSPRLLINQDISTVDMDMLRGLMSDGPQIAVLHISLQCDDFSACKASSLKASAIDNLTTSRDLVYDALRLVETVRPGAVVIENVSQFSTSAEGQLLKIKLRKWGYDVTEGVFRGDRFGGLTRRERYYLVASVWPGYEMPEEGEARNRPIWSSIEPYLAGCRDASHTKTAQLGVETGRIRLITPESVVSPTLLKSQSRQSKDACYIAPGDGRLLLPSLELQRFLQGIPDSFDMNAVSGTIASEIVGQSIEYTMHHAIVSALHQHITENVGAHVLVNIGNRASQSAKLPRRSGDIPAIAREGAFGQISLF